MRIAITIPAAIMFLGGFASAAEVSAFQKTVAPFIAEHCVRCHGADQPKGKLRLDILNGDLKAKPNEIAVWKSVLDQMETAQ